MKTIVILSLSAIMLYIPLIAQGQSLNSYYINYEYTEYSQSEYITLINDSIKNNLNPETGHELEHPLRRFEITFFISLPFVFILTFISLHMFDVIKEKDPDVNVWKDYKPYLLTGTFGISSIIAFREAWICMETNRKKREEDKHGMNERTFYLFVNKKF